MQPDKSGRRASSSFTMHRTPSLNVIHPVVSVVPPALGRRRPRVSMELARFAGLLALVGLIWAWHYEMTTPDAWQTPANYFGDSHEMLTRIQAAAEGNTVPLQPQVLDRLGAPWGAHWNSYPTPDKVLVGGLGLLARFFGWGIVSNLALLMAALSSAASFYWVARRFQAEWEWAAAGALLFAFTYSVFHRGLGHLLLLFTWTIPLGLITCWFVARRLPLEWTSRRAWVCAFAALSLGASNPYNLFFWLQLLAWALAAQAVRPSRGSNLRGIGLDAEIGCIRRWNTPGAGAQLCGN